MVFNMSCPFKFILLALVMCQGRLKIWTEHSTLILLNLKLFDVSLQKFQKALDAPDLDFLPKMFETPCGRGRPIF